MVISWIGVNVFYALKQLGKINKAGSFNVWEQKNSRLTLVIVCSLLK